VWAAVAFAATVALLLAGSALIHAGYRLAAQMCGSVQADDVE